MAVSNQQSGAVHELINFHSFPTDDLVLTKSGSLGMFLKLGVCDPECLDKAALDRITHAVGEALRQVKPGIRVNTIRLKTAGPNIPRQASYTNEAAGKLVTSYVDELEKRAGNLYSEEIYLGFFLKIPSAKTARLSPWRFWTKKYLKLLRNGYEKTEQTLRRNVEACSLLLNDVVPAEPIEKTAIFNLLLRMLNPAPEKQELKLPSDEHIDFFVANEHIGCFDDHLRIGDRFVIVLTLKAPPSETRPNWLYAALKVPCNFAVVQEALRLAEDKARIHVNLQQRHFAGKRYRMMPTQLFKSISENEQLKDSAALAHMEELEEFSRAMDVNGTSIIEFSLTVVITADTLEEARAGAAEFQKVFARQDAVLIPERYNLFPAYLSHIPGHDGYNVRRLYLTDSNFADLAPIFRSHIGNTKNDHLNAEYLTVLETNDSTPYFLNLHVADVAHTLIFGMTGAGKSVLVQSLIASAIAKYDPLVYIFDVGGSYRALTELLGGSYLYIGKATQPFRCNPFSLENTTENRLFLVKLVRMLIDQNGFSMSTRQETEVSEAVANMYQLDPSVRRLGTFAAMLSRELAEQLAPWINDGKFSFVFDNVEDTLKFSRFQTFDFEHADATPELTTARLLYILHRINEQVGSVAERTTPKFTFIDEASVLLGHPVTAAYARQGLKMWRKRNGTMVLATQSSDDIARSEIVQVAVENCPTKLFLANHDMNEEVYGHLFHLNAEEIRRIRQLRPKRQFLLKQPTHSKVLNLNVDPKSYWLFTTNPYEIQRREEAFLKYGITRGLKELAKEKHA